MLLRELLETVHVDTVARKHRSVHNHGWNVVDRIDLFRGLQWAVRAHERLLMNPVASLVARARPRRADFRFQVLEFLIG